tara:strand:- start:534 stop:1349 length:816 start_codon:yes stop_codon:yes gene_type:complete
MTLRINLTVIALLFSASVGVAADEVAQYSVREGMPDKLIATYEDQQYWLTNEQDQDAKYSLELMQSIYLHEQLDLDGDGNIDLLFTATNGGASAIGRYYVASHLGDHYFTITSAEELYTYGGYKLLKQDDGSTHIKFYHSLDGAGSHDRIDGFSIHKLSSGKLELVSSVVSHAQIPTLMDILSSDLEQVGEKTYEFDIDSDGTLDKFLCRYWARWGDVLCGIQLSSIGLIKQSWGTDHIGVAETKTNGVNDLVIEWVGLMKFDGAKFVQAK